MNVILVKEGKIIEATETELFKRYLATEMDDIYSFPDYLSRMKSAGVNVINE